MLIDLAVRANLWMERHRRLVLAVTVVVFALTCAHWARLIRLPEIIAIPVTLSGILMGVRYAMWEGWLKPVVDARTAQALGREPSARSVRRKEARADRKGVGEAGSMSLPPEPPSP